MGTMLCQGAAAQVSPPAAASPETKVLLAYTTLKSQIQPDETHSYRLMLIPGQFARIVIEQQGLDAEVCVYAPDNSLYLSIDSPNGSYGPEIISVLPSTSGYYTIKIYPNKTLPPGAYELRVDGPRRASPRDETYVTAERLFAQAQKLRGEGYSLQKPAADEKFSSAITEYNEALALWQELGDARAEGYSLCNIGRVYRALGKSELALDRLVQAVSRLRDAGDLSGEAFALNEIGAVHRDFGDQRNAVASYEEALQLRLRVGDRYGQAQLYNNLGLVFSNIGYQPQAAVSLEKALHLWRELGLRDSEMNSLINAANARVTMGDTSVALAQFQTVLAFCNEFSGNNSPLQATAVRLKPFALNGIGLVYETWADPDTARINYLEAAELFRTNKNMRSEADVLDNLGTLHAFLGDATAAVDYFQKALTIREQLGEPKGWGVTLSDLGFAYALQGEYKEARERLELAYSFSMRSHDQRFVAYTLLRLGIVFVALKEPQEALKLYQNALTIQTDPKFADVRGQAITLDKMAEALSLAGDGEAALKEYKTAIELWKSIGDEQGEALSLFGVARIERDRLHLANARDRAEQAIHLVENLRNRVTNRQLQVIYFAGKQDLFALAIDIRIQLYKATNSTADLEAALSISERARARSLLDLLTESNVDLSKSIFGIFAEKNSHLQRQISALAQTLLRMRSIGAKESAALVEQRLAAYIRDQDELLVRARRADPTSALSRQAHPLASKEIQQLLDDDTVLLQYSLDEKRSHLWQVTRGEINYFPLAGQGEIETAANQLRRALVDLEPQRQNEVDPEQTRKRRQAARANYGQSAANLSRLILNDVAPQLGNKRLVIVADGALQSIPFEALPLPDSVVTLGHHTANTAQRPLLLASNEIVYQPSASTLAMLRRIPRPSTRKTVAVLADPVFNNNQRGRGSDIKQPVHPAKEKLTRSLRDIGDSGNGDFSLQRLEFSRQEAKAITAVAPRGTSMIAVGFEANRALATSPILKQFSIVHFATHGILNDKNPELSGLVLSMFNKRGQPQDGYLTLRDIYNLDLPVHLVVVSACETGVGRPVRGEGLIALTRGFMNAGAQSIVVSLWRVEDEETAELMKRFYTHLFSKDKPSPAAALRQAKLEMKDNYHPYHWAGFVLQGDWK